MARGTDGGLELKKITDEQVEERTVSALHTSGRPKPVHHHPPTPTPAYLLQYKWSLGAETQSLFNRKKP